MLLGMSVVPQPPLGLPSGISGSPWPGRLVALRKLGKGQTDHLGGGENMKDGNAVASLHWTKWGTIMGGLPL